MESVELRGELSQSFTLTEGGPGAAIMKRLHLVRPERRADPGRIALILTTLSWLPLFALCIFEGLAFGRVEIPFVHDMAAHTRFLIAVPVLALADIPIGARLHEITRHFVTAHLVPDEKLQRFEEDLRNVREQLCRGRRVWSSGPRQGRHRWWREREHVVKAL